MARMSKLSKKIEGTDVIFGILDDEGDAVETITINTGDYPKNVQDHLIPFGAGHKLGDAAATANTPEERKEAIMRVHESMLTGEWSVRRPAEPKDKTPKVSKKAIMANLSALSEDEQAAAKAILAKLGFAL